MPFSFSTRFALINLCFCIASCKQSPEKYFDQAVLNSNMLVGFADDGFSRQLEQPSAKMGKTKDEVLQMKRTEVVDNQIRFAEESYANVKDLTPSDDTKEMVNASMAMYQLVLPVYKAEYRKLAKLYDDGAPKNETEALTQEIHDKYSARFEALYDKLMTAGKVYAANNKINVKWGM